MKLLQHVRLLPGRGLIRRRRSYHWGNVISAEGYRPGEQVAFDYVEAVFSKGKTHYAVVLVKHMRRVDGYQGSPLPRPPADE